MLYFLALFLPPLAVGWCAGTGALLLNLVLTVCGIVPGIVHALFIVSRYYADERHAEMISAITGKARTPRAIGAGIVGLAGIVLAGGMGLSAWRTFRSVQSRNVAAASADKHGGVVNAGAHPLPILDGWSYTEVVSTHGAPAMRDKTTAWAEWPSFRAHFTNGAVDQVQPR